MVAAWQLSGPIIPSVSSGCSLLLLLLQDAVSLCDATGNEFARGLSNFDSKVRTLLLST
jgi:hypothetical protein